jgi:hypothetical protein
VRPNALSWACSMPLVLREGGFQVRIYLNDHIPAHVHVFNADGEVQIALEPVRIEKVWSMKPADAARAKALVISHREALMIRWREVHG